MCSDWNDATSNAHSANGVMQRLNSLVIDALFANGRAVGTVDFTRQLSTFRELNGAALHDTACLACDVHAVSGIVQQRFRCFFFFWSSISTLHVHICTS